MTITRDAGNVKGVSWVASSESSIHNILNTASCLFHAPLQASLFLSRGAGSPTFSRATKAWALNELGILEELPSGCAFFAGARLVFNSVRTTSEDFSNAIWVKTNCTVVGTNVIVCSYTTSLQRISQEASGASARAVVIGTAYRFSARIRRVSNGAQLIQLTAVSGGFGTGQYANFSLVDGSVLAVGCIATSTLVAGTTDTYDLSIRCVATANGSFDIFNVIFINSMSDARTPSFIGDGLKSFELLRAWSVDVTGYTASYVPEYVSVGVVSAPFFGAGVDGAKYYETDWQGALISAANLLGFRKETAATNNLLHCRDLSNAAWSTKTNLTADKTATGLDGIANTATTLTATTADAIILQPITLASAERCASAYVKRITGTETISFTQDGGSSWTDITSQINSNTYSRVQVTSTLANPSVGFKISTSGDAIAVDIVQNEAGSVATSPIVTTTAIVTRNADSLTYQISGNWSDTAGTAFVEVAPLAYSGGAIGSATNGLLLSTLNSGATAYDGTNSANGPSGTPGSSEKLAFRWGSSAMTVSSGGIIGTPGTYDGGMGLSSIGIGSSAAGCFKNAAIYNYAMTDAELQGITA